MRLFAPAKVNLALHLLGRRENGYHELDSLVGFATVGDWLVLEPASEWHLEVTGPFAQGVPVDERNLLCKARVAFEAATGTSVALRVRLEKNLPHGAGLGGGSMDAVRLLHVLRVQYAPQMPEEELVELATLLGGDMRAAMHYPRAAWLRMRGIGERVEVVPLMPPVFAVLTHAGANLSTPNVYKATKPEDFGGPISEWPKAGMLAWLNEYTANQLTAAAERLESSIAPQCAALRAQPGCVLARMSGSGSACFGLFLEEAEARAAAEHIKNHHPHWWVMPTTLGLDQGTTS